MLTSFGCEQIVQVRAMRFDSKSALGLRSLKTYSGTGSRAQPRKRAPYSRRHLRWEIHAAHQALEARVGPQVIEAGIDLQQNHPLRLLLVCSL